MLELVGASATPSKIEGTEKETLFIDRYIYDLQEALLEAPPSLDYHWWLLSAGILAEGSVAHVQLANFKGTWNRGVARSQDE